MSTSMGDNTPNSPRNRDSLSDGDLSNDRDITVDRDLTRDNDGAARVVHTETTRHIQDDSPRTDRESVHEREKNAFGGIKWGSAFFGWLTATGTAALLTGLLAAGGTVAALATDTDAGQAANEAADNAETTGIVGAIALAVILFLAYYCGGYVAGRMARFDGAKQGVAVWIWALLAVLVLTIIGLIAGNAFDLAALGSNFALPVNLGDLTSTGIISALVIGALTLVAAVLGGLAGMRYHRKVDEVGLGH